MRAISLTIFQITALLLIVQVVETKPLSESSTEDHAIPVICLFIAKVVQGGSYRLYHNDKRLFSGDAILNACRR